jgi:hypothetical protein
MRGSRVPDLETCFGLLASAETERWPAGDSSLFRCVVIVRRLRG